MKSISMRSHARSLRGARNVGRVFGWTPRGSALQTPTRAFGDQEMLETASSRGSPPSPASGPGEESSTRGSRPVPTRQAARKSGGLVTSTARSLALVGAPQGGPANENRSDGLSPVVLSEDESRPRPATIRRRRRGKFRAPARPPGVSEEPAFRVGGAHDRIEVAEVGRTASSSWTRAAAGNRGGATKRNAAKGNLRGASERPADGRRSGSSVPAAIVTDRRRRVVSAARSQTPPLPSGKGGLLPQAKATRASAMRRQEDRRSAVTGASEDGESVDLAGR
jgi:hypothetical protein